MLGSHATNPGRRVAVLTVAPVFVEAAVGLGLELHGGNPLVQPVD
jgi:hypothetical protein